MTLASDPRVQIMDMISGPLYLVDADQLAIVWANDSALAYWEAPTPDELYTRDLKARITATVWLRIAQVRQECFDHGRTVIEHWSIRPGKTLKSSDYRISAFHTDDARQLLLLQIMSPAEQLDPLSAYRTMALEHTTTMISAYSADLSLIYCNNAARASIPESTVSGRERIVDPVDLQTIMQSLTSVKQCDIEAAVNTVTGIRWHALNVQRCIDPISTRSMYLVTESDITEKRSQQLEAYRLAFTDSLTDLPNRAALDNYLDDILNNPAKQHFALMFLDLDRFKIINDSLGHRAGDRLLIHVARQLQKALGNEGLVYRLGGDEFVALATHTTDHEKLKTIAQKIIMSLATPIVIDGHKLRALPSIGISTYPVDGHSASDLMENADTAMYIAKAKKSGFRFFDAMMSSSISENVKDQMDLENDMVAALENNEFELYYQPKLRCDTLAVTGVEALIRWHHPTRGMVLPDNFIGIAEDTGQIIDIGNWVLQAATTQQRKWHHQGLIVPVSVNISPRQFRANDLLADVSTALKDSGCAPHMIELEITESMLIGEPDVVNETLLKLSALGIRLALDDFGTGFANLDSLQRYPLDSLKIDRVFLCDRKRSMLMSTILKIGKVLGLETIAEGVETGSQIDWLAANGCNQMQGFFFSKPLPAAQMTEFLLENGAPRGKTSHAA